MKHVKKWTRWLAMLGVLALFPWWGVARAQPAPGMPGQAPVPGQGGVPGATPGIPGKEGGGIQPPVPAPGQPRQGEWTLSDLLEGILRMDAQPGLRLNAAQVAKIRPALERVSQASRQISDAERRMKAVLTPDQIKFIQDAQRNGTLSLEPPAGTQAKPGEDPMVMYVIQLLEKKAR